MAVFDVVVLAPRVYEWPSSYIRRYHRFLKLSHFPPTTTAAVLGLSAGRHDEMHKIQATSLLFMSLAANQVVPKEPCALRWESVDSSMLIEQPSLAPYSSEWAQIPKCPQQAPPVSFICPYCTHRSSSRSTESIQQTHTLFWHNLPEYKRKTAYDTCLQCCAPDDNHIRTGKPVLNDLGYNDLFYITMEAMNPTGFCMGYR